MKDNKTAVVEKHGILKGMNKKDLSDYVEKHFGDVMRELAKN